MGNPAPSAAAQPSSGSVISGGGAKLVLVVAVALIDSQRVLLARRPPGKHLEGLWEFPGGKLESGETPEEALRRELGDGVVVHRCVDELVCVVHRHDVADVISDAVDLTDRLDEPH